MKSILIKDTTKQERIEKYKPEIYSILIKEYEAFKDRKYEDSDKKKGEKDEKKK